MLPIPPIALQLRTGIAIVSYADELVFGITADYDAAPDVDELARGIEQQWRGWSRWAHRLTEALSQISAPECR